MLAAIPQPLADTAQRDAAAIRGQALFQLGRPADAVRVLVEREVWLSDAASILANQRMIWDGFRQYSPSTAPAPTGDTIVDGWLALAPLATTTGTELRRALLTWRQTYTNHPAAGGLLAELLAAQRSRAFRRRSRCCCRCRRPSAHAALAIRDGFMAAHLRDPQRRAPTVRVYDSTGLGSREAYLHAQLDGADFIVGPLLQPEVDQVIAQAGFVPTLALNFATERRHVPAQLLPVRAGARGRSTNDRCAGDRRRREDRDRVRAEQRTWLPDSRHFRAEFEAPAASWSTGTATSRRCRISRSRSRRC